MFIEKLWEEKPELVVKEVKKIFGVNKEKGDRLKFKKLENGVLTFVKYGHDGFNVYVNDFSVSTINAIPYKLETKQVKDWMSFMFDEFGDEYIYEFLSHRNNQLDKFKAEFESNFNNETMNAINQLGFRMDKGNTK
ncbi:MAG: hypothetical protein IJA72_01450 [Clostridia bacterium]|nr:hypothetical protein [Clostridia bacterium]